MTSLMPVTAPNLRLPLLGSVLLATLCGGRLDGQSSQERAAHDARLPATRARLLGVVTDAASNRPLPAAVVWLRDEASEEVAERDAFRKCAVLAAGDRSIVATARADSAGAYSFDDLTPGRYTLCVRAAGYAARALRVTLEAASTSRVHVGISALPTVLAPVGVREAAKGTFDGAHGSGSSTVTGALFERLRQARYLTSDSRLLTVDDVARSSGLGELDVMRAVQELPGVAARDDYTAMPWTRGAPADQTTVTFDGLPLLNPYHGVGAVSGLNVEAIGDAAFHPGVAPTELAGGAAGTLELRSRHPSRPGVSGSIGLSGVAASARIDGMTGDKGVAGTISVRRSHLDLSNRSSSSPDGTASRGLPYAFEDVAGHGDILMSGWRLEGSALFMRDRLWAPVAGIVDGGTGQWGGSVAQLSVTRSILGGALRTSIGGSASAADLLANPDTRLEPAGIPDDSSLYAVRETIFRPQPIRSRGCAPRDARVASRC
ncbi:MAG: carboxypeptidase regulatory-like domain-containing protein [bacterium]